MHIKKFTSVHYNTRSDPRMLCCKNVCFYIRRGYVKGCRFQNQYLVSPFQASKVGSSSWGSTHTHKQQLNVSLSEFELFTIVKRYSMSHVCFYYFHVGVSSVLAFDWVSISNIYQCKSVQSYLLIPILRHLRVDAFWEGFDKLWLLLDLVHDEVQDHHDAVDGAGDEACSLCCACWQETKIPGY